MNHNRQACALCLEILGCAARQGYVLLLDPESQERAAVVRLINDLGVSPQGSGWCCYWIANIVKAGTLAECVAWLVEHTPALAPALARHCDEHNPFLN